MESKYGLLPLERMTTRWLPALLRYDSIQYRQYHHNSAFLASDVYSRTRRKRLDRLLLNLSSFDAASCLCVWRIFVCFFYFQHQFVSSLILESCRFRRNFFIGYWFEMNFRSKNAHLPLKPWRMKNIANKCVFNLFIKGRLQFIFKPTEICTELNIYYSIQLSLNVLLRNRPVRKKWMQKFFSVKNPTFNWF